MGRRGIALFTMVLGFGSIVGCKTNQGSEILSTGATRVTSPARKYFSAVRGKDESYKTVLAREAAKFSGESRQVDELSLKGSKKSGSTPAPQTVNEAAVNFANIDAAKAPVPVWTQQQLLAGFQMVRDKAYLKDLSRPSTDPFIVRRLSWLYPDDGCFARAAEMGRLLQEAGYPRPVKVFSIGDLEVRSANAADGAIVRWGYHVAPIVKVDGRLFVLDPSIEAQRPLELSAWIDVQTPSREQISVAICDEHALDPIDPCFGSSNDDADAKAVIEADFLGREWERQLTLHGGDNTNAKVKVIHLLSDNPPWLSVTKG